MRSREKADWPSLGHRGWGLSTIGSRQTAHAGTQQGAVSRAAARYAQLCIFHSVVRELPDVSRAYVEHSTNFKFRGQEAHKEACPSSFLTAPKTSST